MLAMAGIEAIAAYGMPTAKVAQVLRVETCRVIVMNDDKLSALEESLLKWAPSVYIGDESHRFRTASSARGRSMRKIAWQAKYVRLLTGTPTPNNIGNLWGQFAAIDKELWGKSYTQFAKKHLIRDSMFPSKILGVLHADELREKVSSCSSIVNRADVFGPDQWQTVVRDVQMPPKAYKLYKDLVKEWVVSNSLEKDEVIDVTHTLTRMTRLQQLTSGFIVDTEGNTHQVHSAKTDLVMNDLEEIIESGEKVVVFHKFTAEGTELYERCIRQFGRDQVFKIAGDVSGSAREAAISSFNSNHQASVFIVQTQAGGIGISLASAVHVLFISQSFSYDIEQQARDRIYSPGRSKCVSFYRVTKSIDSYVGSVLEQKQNVQNAVTSSTIHEIAFDDPKPERGIM
jgi:SNF2 family DNA or RNA helicase